MLAMWAAKHMQTAQTADVTHYISNEQCAKKTLCLPHTIITRSLNTQEMLLRDSNMNATYV